MSGIKTVLFDRPCPIGVKSTDGNLLGGNFCCMRSRARSISLGDPVKRNNQLMVLSHFSNLSCFIKSFVRACVRAWHSSQCRQKFLWKKLNTSACRLFDSDVGGVGFYNRLDPAFSHTPSYQLVVNFNSSALQDLKQTQDRFCAMRATEISEEHWNTSVIYCST